MRIDSLRALQHRGQVALGIAIPNRPPLKKLGLVSLSRTGDVAMTRGSEIFK